jgi:DNA adenine methylase
VKAKTLSKAEQAKHAERASVSGATSMAATRASSALSASSSDILSETLAAAHLVAAPETLLRPPLKWAGGKRWLVPYLARLWQPHPYRRYVEPFCGGLAAPIGLRPKQAVLNDINPHLINFYTHLQQGLELTIAMENNETLFYSHRLRFNKLVKAGKWQSAEAAQLFYYLNRTCFNGLCRFNKAGEFNVPFGQHNSITYATSFSRFKPLFENWLFTNKDIELLAVEPEDFIYADPPYDVEFTTYSAGGFSWDDQVRTAEWLAAHIGPVVLSNQATARVVKLYRKLGFEIEYLAGPRRISCTGDRRAAREVLATKGF